MIRVRRVQGFFRDAVLTSYRTRCAISGIALPELLVASHIIPWGTSVERRADPCNGLCLNALLDRAFDRGLFTINDDLRVVISSKLRDIATEADLPSSLNEIEGRTINMPYRFAPDLEALRHHRELIFKR
jgi:predicted restriction endonuclease